MTWLLVESYPEDRDPSDLPDPDQHEAVNWARGDVSILVTQRYDEDADTWEDVHNGYDVYGQSWTWQKWRTSRTTPKSAGMTTCPISSWTSAPRTRGMLTSCPA